MKIASLLCAAVLALAPLHAADAKPGSVKKKAAHAHTAAPAKRPRAPQRDPWAAYWQDQSRYEFPSWGLRGGW